MLLMDRFPKSRPVGHCAAIYRQKYGCTVYNASVLAGEARGNIYFRCWPDRTTCAPTLTCKLDLSDEVMSDGADVIICLPEATVHDKEDRDDYMRFVDDKSAVLRFLVRKNHRLTSSEFEYEYALHRYYQVRFDDAYTIIIAGRFKKSTWEDMTDHKARERLIHYTQCTYSQKKMKKCHVNVVSTGSCPLHSVWNANMINASLQFCRFNVLPDSFFTNLKSQ